MQFVFVCKASAVEVEVPLEALLIAWAQVARIDLPKAPVSQGSKNRLGILDILAPMCSLKLCWTHGTIVDGTNMRLQKSPPKFQKQTDSGQNTMASLLARYHLARPGKSVLTAFGCESGLKLNSRSSNCSPYWKPLLLSHASLRCVKGHSVELPPCCRVPTQHIR